MRINGGVSFQYTITDGTPRQQNWHGNHHDATGAVRDDSYTVVYGSVVLDWLALTRCRHGGTLTITDQWY
jgi:hypothetical protein